MDSKEILRAVQAGKIKPEDARRELMSIIKSGTGQNSGFDLTAQDQKQRYSSQELSCAEEDKTLFNNEGIPDITPDKSLQNAIAVIGMAGQFPKAKNLAEFWDNLARGNNCISEIPSARWPIEAYYDSDPKVPGKTYCKWGGVMEDADKFDPLFFNISPAEAELMDPQQRLFLESCWHCIEDAGLNPSQLSGSRCGVYVGCTPGDYSQLTGEKGLTAQGLMGGSISILAARISYFLNLKGPCLSIDTACSASLVALAEACNNLVLQTCDLALAGGVCSLAGPSMHVMSSKAGMLSKDGRCFTFDARANGFVPGEGVGVVLLKRLSDAVREHDHIYGVIRGWGINQDGKTNGITAPSVNSQILLEQEVYQRFHINPETISLVEAHGTGTKLGDPIEVEALTESFQAFTYKKNYCALGSVKSNIGHLFGAAGIAGVIKVLLALQHRMLPPTINFEKLNEYISLDKSPFYINTGLQPWETAHGAPRRAAVSSFGFSGTNAHVVIEEYLPRDNTANATVVGDPGNPVLFVLSAKSEERLKVYAESMKNFIESHEDLNLADMTYTLQVGREAMEYRLALVTHSKEVLTEALERFVEGNPPAEVLTCQIYTGKGGTAASNEVGSVESLLQAVAQKEKLRRAADSWVKGASVDWNKFYGEVKPRRISLSVYPFARERYWAAELHTGTAAAPSEVAGSMGVLPDQDTDGLAEDYSESSVETGLKRIVSGILRIPEDRIGREYELTRYGLDSISAMSLIDHINRRYGIELSPRIVFEYDSISRLTRYILNEKRLNRKAVTDIVKTELSGQTDSFSLSAAQEGLWLINQLAPDSYAYNLPSAFLIRKRIDIKALENAFKAIVRRHPILCARIRLKDQEPVHTIDSSGYFLFQSEDVSNISGTEFKNHLMMKARQPFDLENGPLMRVYLFSLSEEEHVLLINIHHIVFDGSSLPVLLRELLHLYAIELAGKHESLPGPGKSYADFVHWQSELLAGEEGRKHKAYWLQKLSGELPVLDLPVCRQRTGTSAFKGKTYVEKISRELTNRIQQLSMYEKVSPFVLMLSALKALLHRYTNQEDIMIGTAVQGRPGIAYESSIGYFTNMVLIRSTVSGEASFRDLLRQVQANTFEALEHGNYPFSEIVKEKRGKQNRGDSPFIQIAFIFQNWLKNTDQLFLSEKHGDGQQLLTLEPIPEIHQEGEFDISLDVIKDEDRYHLYFKYNPEFFDGETIARICDHYIEILRSITANCQQGIAQTGFITEPEKSKLLSEWVDTKTDYPKNECVHQLFEEQVRKTPDNIAVIFKDQTLTYSALNKKSNQLARVLRSRGVKPDSIVGIMVERSLEMAIGLFGIIKAGGAYLPIDPGYPKDRIQYMLKNSGADILLVQHGIRSEIEFDGEIIFLDGNETYGMDDSDLNCINRPTDLAYVIYTSGSTGNPKGVMIEHHSLVNRLKWMQKAYPLGNSDTILQKTPYTFDVSVWELFWWSLEGAKVCFLPPKAEKDPQVIVEAIEKNQITVMHFVPSMLNIFMEYIQGTSSGNRLSSLRQVFASGEALTPSQVKLFNEMLYRQNSTRLMNLYGPTEATIDVSYFDCSSREDFEKIPIGKPIDNIKLYIVDRDDKLQPVGIPGELCIAGVGLARGYLNNQPLTEQKFVENPFEPGARMYKTGDLAKWTNDGNIEYLGRIDRQVKIRGFRIELGEIEAVLSLCEHVKDACVVVDGDKDMSGNARLKAYVVAKGEKRISPEGLKRYLKEKLPDYMIPSIFVEIESIPLTAHGKADVKALSAYDEKRPVHSLHFKEQGGDIENTVAKIYGEMLQVDEIDPEANFFDLGGHSMLLVKAAIKLRDVLQREITTVELFQYPTAASLARHLSLETKQEKKADPFERSRRKAMKQRDILMKLNQFN